MGGGSITDKVRWAGRFVRAPAATWAERRTRPVPEYDLRANVAEAPAVRSTLERLAVEGRGREFTKWWHYFAVYERILGELARCSREGGLASPLRVLEIGVWRGGSLDLWRSYFGPTAVLFGVDVDERCADLDQESGQIRIGSQADPGFLRSVVEEMGGVDVVIDDGSHVPAHVRASLEALWPLLATPGTYIVEDLHTSYWPEWGGGLRRSGSSVEFLTSLVDVLHAPYFGARPTKEPTALADGSLVSIEFSDSMAVLRKGEPVVPAIWFGGRPGAQGA